MAVVEQDAPSGAGDEEQVRPRRRRSRVVIVVLALVAVVAAAVGAYGLLTPTDPVEDVPVPGEVVAVEPLSVNLAGGHYLRLGFAMQLTAEAHDVDVARARDAAIDLFSGRPLPDVTDAQTRTELRDELAHQLHEIYEGEVIDVFYTDYVTQ